MRLRPSPRLLLALLLLPEIAAARLADFAAQLHPAQEALAAGDYQTAYARYMKSGKRNPLAQFMIGLFHRNGWGRPADPVVACVWFEKAAQRHIPAAEHQWGECLARGTGRPVDVPAALSWYERAADHGHLISWCAAADHYIRGDGVAKDMARGLELCGRVAQAGSPPAMLQLAGYYREGRDLPRDLAQARRWYEAAARRNTPEAQYRLGLMLADGQGGEADADAALFWLESAATQGYAPAYLPTAVLYANQPVQPDTGALSPEHLAKIYLWLGAAKATGIAAEQQALVEHMDALLATAMPDTWKPQLDRLVAEHLAKHPPDSQTNSATRSAP